MKEINLREILEKYDKVFFEDSSDSKDTAIQIDDVLSAMKEACEHIVDLCEENFEINSRLEENNEYHKWIDSESILKVKQLIK
jgi:hypothetical protein